MSIKTMLVHLDADKYTPPRLDSALALAGDHNASLVGLYVRPRVEVPANVQAYIDAEILAANERAAREQAGRIETMFRERCEKAGVSHEWRCEIGDRHEIVTIHARHADIAVLGQTPPEESDSLVFAHLPEDVALGSGRPVIVVPYAGVHTTIGRRVLVAWNGSREAVRAVYDALPILERAERVIVLSVNPGEMRHIPGADITAQLARHGVKAEASETASEALGVGDVLLSRAVDLGVDLIVMGAYGHSRAREWIAGGATRHLLAHMTVPVLFSH